MWEVVKGDGWVEGLVSLSKRGCVKCWVKARVIDYARGSLGYCMEGWMRGFGIYSVECWVKGLGKRLVLVFKILQIRNLTERKYCCIIQA